MRNVALDYGGLIWVESADLVFGEANRGDDGPVVPLVGGGGATIALALG